MDNDEVPKKTSMLWGNLDESARFAREQAEVERVARDIKSRRVKEMRLAKAKEPGADKPK